ncbi:MAG: squalene--hopene cyclase [Candidatus Binatus sp.]|uniref:squalene--hopene cyclase n=1 Tax=Candidatus Binatus sp. TaxID=2811406 RepID=UPI002725FFFA|nr:squalene--hopene cyclase [Candidatus Binatus sp.]MDO8430837.1 squalene--hopene cyclase [Candidatus Binatus sp.]
MSQAISIDNMAALSPHDEFVAKVDYTIERAQNSLLALQKPEGYWHGALEANAEMNAEYIIFTHFMDTVDIELEARLKKYLLDTQSADGSWSLFPGGEGYLSSTIEAYFALKLTGMRAGDEPMAQARRWILAKGGIVNCGTLARFYLAAMGQITWDATAALPIEIVLLPNWFPINIYELGSWARGTLMALMLMQTARPAKQIDYQRGILELYIQPPHFTKFKQPRGKKLLSLRNLLNVGDRGLRLYDKHNVASLRASAIRKTEEWIVDHQDENGSWGGIEPCYLLSAMALKAIGYRNDHPVLRKAIAASRELVWDFPDSALYMPCVSPNWDSALAGRALLDSGIAGDHPALRKAASWFIDHQIFNKGDWSVKRPALEAGGWAFQFYNDSYPDVDDSAVILSVLAESSVGDAAAKERSMRAGANWVMGMQSKDGGFAAFDADNDSTWMNHLPLADVEAVTDPSCPDLTGRVLDMMASVGYRSDHPVAKRAIEWLKRNQSSHGGWWGRWGVNYIYGTSSALSGLRAIGVDMKQPWIRRAVAWLKSKQNADGGWGESPLSDQDPAWHGRGTSTASQTAWALIALVAGEDDVSESAMRGAQWLSERQNDDGAWDETEHTGNGFPNHFYLRYHLYAHYFPLMALGRFRRRLMERSAR